MESTTAHSPQFARNANGPRDGRRIAGTVRRVPAPAHPVTAPALAAAERLQLARAVAAGDRGFVVHSDNTAGPWADLNTHVSTGTAFAVEPHPTLLVIDYDLAGCAPAERSRRRQNLDLLRDALAAADIPRVEVRSGRTGHRHLFARIGRADPAARTALEAFCRRGGLDVRTTGVRPPLAPHRTGEEPRLAHPRTPSAALDVLARRPASAEQLRTVCQHLGLGGLSSRMRRLLREGHAACGYASASNGRMALAVAVLAAGHPPDYLAALLSDRGNQLGDTFRARPAAWQTAEVARLEGKARAYIAAGERPVAFTGQEQARRDVATWRDALRHADWAGMSGATDLAVAEGMARLATAAGGPAFTASLPAIALAAGVSHSTARRALRRLARRGLLRLIEEATATTARRYRLQVPAQLRALSASRRGSNRPDPVRVDPKTGAPVAIDVRSDLGDSSEQDAAQVQDLGSDLARWGAAGKSAVRVLRELRRWSQPLEAIAEAIGSTVNAVRLQLRKLERLGLAVRSQRGWRRGSESPDQVAHDLGTAGRRDQQAASDERVRRERATMRERWRAAYLDAVDVMRNGDDGRLASIAQVFGEPLLEQILERIRRGLRREALPEAAG